MSRKNPFKPNNVKARSLNQKQYIRSIVDNDITFCLGPAGTGKTHIAAGMAASMVRGEHLERIILCRPVVGVGKDIGFLPGTKEEKIGPYLMPLFDELGCFIEQPNKLIQQGTIEIVPLSMMRGRSFHQSFVILDEAQNATYSELVTLLTRIGQGSKMVLTGDPRQSDILTTDFVEVANRLQLLEGVGVVHLSGSDIVRHRLISQIISLLG